MSRWCRNGAFESLSNRGAREQGCPHCLPGRLVPQPASATLPARPSVGLSAGEMTDGFSLCLKYCLNPRRVTQGKKTTGEVGSKKAGDSKVKHYQIPP